MPPTLIELTEYQPRQLPKTALTQAEGRILWREYGRYVTVEFPSPKTDDQWQLTVLGWAGYLPLSARLHLVLQPKVPLPNLFRMLEVAYRLPVQLLTGSVECQSLAEFFERLALILAGQVLDRARRGIYRTYLPRSEALPYLRGRLEPNQALRSPWQVRQVCRYQEQTADVEDNQILAWTLHMIARSGGCSERTLPTVRQAYRALRGEVSTQPVSAQKCLQRLYHRLNDDYRPMHALCRFFLEHAGPAHQSGDRSMLPFLVDMARLYELFVAEWLRHSLPPNLRLIPQERVALDEAGRLTVAIDLVLYDMHSDRPHCVLDTKYKIATTPAHADIFQVVTYAEAKGCRTAILLYPSPLAESLDLRIGDIRVISLTFPMTGDWAAAAQTLIDALPPAHHD